MQTPVLTTLSLPAFATRAALWVLASSFSAVAFAQQTEVGPEVETPATEEVADAPDRVARLSFMRGGVSLQGVGETTWAPAVVNRPFAPGDYLRTEPDGRAELQLEETAIRLGSATNFTFLSLDDGALRMRVTSGVLNIRVRELGENDLIEVETPQATASILRPGNYRLEVSPAGGATVVKVSSGMLEARGPGQSLVVRAQQSATLTGTDRLAYTTGTLGAPDSFDEWSLERDRVIDGALSTETSRYVSSDIVGYEELDRYGDWRAEPEYGYVWSPRVVAGWSPYRFGRYTYISRWGWTWIDNEPWGFAPYHYGNWVTIGGRWCWVPGRRHARPIGSPIGHPSSPSHSWHVPTSPPRGISTRAMPRDGVNGDGTRPSFSSQPGQRGLDRNERWRDARGGYRTRPNSDGYRNVRPDLPRNDIPQSGAPSDGSALANDRRMRIPRNEMPRSTFPRNETRIPSAGGRAPVMSSSPSRAEPSRREMARPPPVSRPSPPPQQQQPQPSTRSDSSRPTFGRGSDRGQPGSRRSSTLER